MGLPRRAPVTGAAHQRIEPLPDHYGFIGLRQRCEAPGPRDDPFLLAALREALGLAAGYARCLPGAPGGGAGQERFLRLDRPELAIVDGAPLAPSQGGPGAGAGAAAKLSAADGV